MHPFASSFEFSPTSFKAGKSYLSNLVRPELAKSNKNVEGLWRSITGKMKLNLINNYVTGSYDWYGYDYSGGIIGEIFDSYIKFNWDWKNSDAKGEGIFYTKYKNILIGGWWYLHENIDLRSVIRNQIIPGNQWIFHRFDENDALLNIKSEFDVIKDLISKNDLLTAINTLEKYCKSNGEIKYIHECILLKNRYNRMRQAFRLGIKENSKELNKIILALLELIEIIEDD